MSISIYLDKIFNKGMLLSKCILLFLLFSCKAQTSPEPVLKSAQGSPIVMTCSPGNIAAEDINEDGKPDLVVACVKNNSLTIYKGKGNGEFDVTAGSPLLLPHPPNEIAINDMNIDGHADLIIGTHDRYEIIIAPGDGKGNFSVSPDSSVMMKQGNQPHTHGLGTGDLNGDGRPDIVTANSSDNDIAVALSTGTGRFIPAPGSPFQVGPSPYPLTIGKVNNDPYADIVSTSTHVSSKAVTLLLGDGQGGFRRSDVPLRTASPWFVAIGDINKDRNPDLVMTHSERSELTVLTGNGSGQFTEVSGSPFKLGGNAWHVSIADLNRDGNPDVFAASNNSIRVMFGDGKGQFVAPGTPFFTGEGTWHLAVSDVNGDGMPDVITSNLESNNISVLLAR